MYTIREATPADAPVLAELVGKTLQECLDEYVLPDELQSCIDVRLQGGPDLRAPSNGTYCFLAEEGGQAVGYGVVQARPVRPTEGVAPSVLRDRLYVRRSWQGKGIARALADAMQPKTALQVPGAAETWSAAMRALYTRWGFVDVGVLTLCMSGPSHMMQAVMEAGAR